MRSISSPVCPSGIGLGICGARDEFVPALALGKEVTMRFSLAYDEKDSQYTVDAFERDAVHRSLMIRNTLSLAELPGALESIRGGAPAEGKLVVQPER